MLGDGDQEVGFQNSGDGLLWEAGEETPMSYWGFIAREDGVVGLRRWRILHARASWCQREGEEGERGVFFTVFTL